jgi:hypothetical protein
MTALLPIGPRLPNWRPRLLAEMEAAMHRPFEWGRQDCVLFVGDCIHAMTGKDPVADIRGRYADEAGARALFEELSGGRTWFGMVRTLLDPVPVAMAQLGDVALVRKEPGGRSMFVFGIVADDRIAAPSVTGLRFAPRTQAHRAFRVP